MAEPEAAMGGLWLASLTAVAESEQRCETSPAAEIMSLEGHAAERITFGVDSGAALTVIGKDVAAEHSLNAGTHEADDGLPRSRCGELRAARPGFVEAVTVPLCPVDGAPVEQEQEERHEVAVRAGGAATPEHDGEDVRDLEQQARERLERVLLRKRPEQPAADKWS